MHEKHSTEISANRIAHHTAVSDYLSLLALLVQLPTKEVESGLASGSLREDYCTICGEVGIGEAAVRAVSSELSSISSRLAKDPGTFHALRCEYTRLFNHPDHPVIKLFEGVFLDDERLRAGKPSTGARLFVNPAALDAERCYRKAGLKKSSEINIPADCISTELEFLGHLHATKARAIVENDADLLEATDGSLKEFMRTHIDKWVPRFFERCAEESGCSLYRAVGMMGTALFDALSSAPHAAESA